MTKRRLATELAMVWIDENPYEFFDDRDKLEGAIDIYNALDRDIDFYYKEINERLMEAMDDGADKFYINRLSELADALWSYRNAVLKEEK